MGEVKSEVIRLRCTSELKEAVEKAAKEEGRSISNFIERLISEKLKNKV